MIDSAVIRKPKVDHETSNPCMILQQLGRQ